MRGVKHLTEDARRAATREAQRRYRERHRERVRAAQRTYVEENAERRAESVRRDWEQRRADPEKYARFLAAGRASYARHSETAKAYTQRWRAANPDRVADMNRRQRERRAQVVVADVRTANLFSAILRRDPCSYCGSRGALDVDHIEPLGSGGVGDWDNLTGACRACNRSKKDRPLLHFLLTAKP